MTLVFDLTAPNMDQTGSVPLRIVARAGGLNNASYEAMITVSPAEIENDQLANLSSLVMIGIIVLGLMLAIVIALLVPSMRKT